MTTGMTTRRKYAAFDLETAAEMDEGEDWRDYRPLGITCAALHTRDFGQPIRWCGTNPDGGIADQMTPEELGLMVRQLVNLTTQQGYTLVTWNGLGFDFDVLAEESGMLEECADLALNHVDMMFQVLCKRGHPLALDTAAKGMGLEGKTEGMDGLKAVRMWRDGEREEVIQYCMQDVRATLDILLASQEAGSLKWVSKSDRNQSLTLMTGWLTVRQALKLPRPNTSWMDDPKSREEFTQWLMETAAGRATRTRYRA